jgi:hypothetical protein
VGPHMRRDVAGLRGVGYGASPTSPSMGSEEYGRASAGTLASPAMASNDGAADAGPQPGRKAPEREQGGIRQPS